MRAGVIRRDGTAGPSMAATRDDAVASIPVSIAPHVLLLVAALAAGAVAQGAFYGVGQRLVGLLVGMALVVAGRVGAWSRADVRSAPVVAGVILAAWALTSAGLAGDLGGARSTVALLAGVLAVILIGRRTSSAQRVFLVEGLLVVGTLVALLGWMGVAWRIEPLAIDSGAWRAASTLTYANAAAGLLVPLALTSLALGSARPERVASVICTFGLLIGVGATLSRGGALALVAGSVTAMVLLGSRRFLRAAAAPAAGAAIALAGLVPSMTAGGPPRPWVATGALVVGLAVTLLGASRGWGRSLTVLLLGVAIVAVVAVFAVAEARGVFGVGRFTLASPDRVEEARAALRLAAEHPVSGVGPGAAVMAWEAPDGTMVATRFAHNEYLQVLAELGVVGLALVLTLLGAMAATVWRSVKVVSAELRAGAAAGLVALAVHSAVDFLWHVPVIPLTVALLVAVTASTIKEDLS